MTRPEHLLPDFRHNRGPDQPDSMQGSTQLGWCPRCEQSAVPLEATAAKAVRGPEVPSWMCVGCIRAAKSSSSRATMRTTT